MAQANCLVESCFAGELRQGGNLAGVVVGRQAVELDFFAHDVLLCLVGWPLLMAGSVQDDQSENVNVPHSVHSGEES